MTGIQLYDVDAAYIHELYQHDKEIRMSKESLRPYLFTTIEINNKPYLIPLSSPKATSVDLRKLLILFMIMSK